MTIPEHPTPPEFEHALRRGLGRALLWLRTHDAEPWRDIITECLTHFTGYDWQIEDSRGRYLTEVIRATGDPDAFLPAVVSAFPERDDWRDLEQLIEVALWFAERGRQEARAALYEVFHRHANERRVGHHVLAAWSLTAVDGVEGLLHVANWMAPRLGERSVVDDLDLPYLLEVADEGKLPGTALAALQAAGASDSAIADLLARLHAEEEAAAVAAPRVPRRRRPLPSYAALRAQIEGTGPSIGLTSGYWGQLAADAALDEAAADVLTATDSQRLLEYLSIFARTGWRRDAAPVLAWARGEDETLAWRAGQALAGRAEPEVRDLAMEYLFHPTRAHWAVGLLAPTLTSTDLQLVRQAMKVPMSDQQSHSFCMGARELVEPLPGSPEVAAILLAIYEDGVCGHCRRFAFKHLLEKGLAPDWLVREARFDASTGDGGTRDMARAEWAKRANAQQ